MLKSYFDESGYYFSCMIPFNLVYLIRIISDGIFFRNIMNWHSWKYIIDFSTFLIVCSAIIFGVVTTMVILFRDDKIKNKNTQGKTIKVKEIEDLTADNYITNYSLWVLTGLAIPSLENILSLIIYVFIVFTLGIVYIKKDLIYINPTLTLLNYNMYKCKNDKDNKKYIILTRGFELKNNETINCLNSQKRIFRLHSKESVDEKS